METAYWRCAMRIACRTERIVPVSINYETQDLA